MLHHLILSFTFPVAIALSCGINLHAPLDDLSTVRVYWMPRYSDQEVMIHEESAVGREGLQGSIPVDVVGEGVLYVTTLDLAGNESCDSNYLVVAETTSVPLQVNTEDPVFWVDIVGRRYNRTPTRSGIYFRCQGNSKQRVVIVR